VSFDIVLSDLSLPDSQGIETFRRIHQAAPALPIIVLSGLANESLAVQTVEEGAQDYLVKGHVDSDLLGRSIRYAIKRAEADKALADERNLLRSVIDNLLDSIYVKDASGHYILDNVAHVRSLRTKNPDSVVGKTVYDFFPVETADRFQQDDDAVLKTGEPI